MSHTTTSQATTSQATTSPFSLVHRRGRFFETLGYDEHWAQGGYEEGHLAGGNTASTESMPTESILIEASFVMPRLPEDAPGKYPILTIARDRPRRAQPDVYFHLSYEPFEERFLIAANAGTRGAELQVFFLNDAPASKYTQRVLRVLVLVNRHGICPSIEDPYTGQRELFAELELVNVSKSGPWGMSPEEPEKGLPWRIRSGAESEHDEEETSFPAGFGLADLRVTLFGESGQSAEDFKTLPYSGELDHLAAGSWDDVNPFGLDEGPQDDGWDFGDDEQMSEALSGLADHIFTLAGGVNTWAQRARGLAEDTQQLARRLTEERETDFQQEDLHNL